MPGALLRLAFQRHRLPLDQLVLHQAYPLPSDDQEPRAIVIQSGGMQALEELGCDLATLANRGCRITRLLLVDDAARPLCALDVSELSRTYRPLWILTQHVRTQLAASFAQEMPGRSADSNERGWKKIACPGVFGRIIAGCLQEPTTQVVWATRHAHAGLAQIREGAVLLYAVPRHAASKDCERDICLAVLDEMAQRFRSRFGRIGEVLEDQWFPLEFVGYRSCWDGRVLRWGPTALRLHPLTGQWLSYWAIQADRLALELARRGALSDRFFASLDHHNRQMFWSHLRSCNFHLRPTLFWRAIHRPYAWTLGHCAPLRRRAMRRTTLLSTA